LGADGRTAVDRAGRQLGKERRSESRGAGKTVVVKEIEWVVCGGGGAAVRMAFVGGLLLGEGSLTRRRVIVCKKKGRVGGSKIAKRNEQPEPEKQSMDGKLTLKKPVVSTKGLKEKQRLPDDFGKDKTLVAASSMFDEDEWIEWDKTVCGEWQETKGPIEFINSLVPELLHLDFPSIAEAIKLVVVIIVLFFLLAGFTYTVDGLYLSLARKFFGEEFFF